MTAVTLNLDAITTLTHEQFRELCRSNRDVRLELTVRGELIVMPPTGWESGKRNASLTGRLSVWSETDATGVAFDSSTGFRLPNGAVRSPDAAWVRKDRLDALDPDPESFLPLAPDFVIELRSASDSAQSLRDKMKEYLENGVRLGWFLNPKDKEVEIYRFGQNNVEVLKSPVSLSGEEVLPGFVLELKGILD
ncbi:Uma2 family endonuclease [Altericista sp. CCNU0014]|uniref:Uma2 family endonuclease n=1 Tax=Altericista sp. CCNU0014 TaxID=3082949 RepID=UPI00384D9C90